NVSLPHAPTQNGDSALDIFSDRLARDGVWATCRGRAVRRRGYLTEAFSDFRAGGSEVFRSNRRPAIRARQCVVLGSLVLPFRPYNIAGADRAVRKRLRPA